MRKEPHTLKKGNKKGIPNLRPMAPGLLLSRPHRSLLKNGIMAKKSNDLKPKIESAVENFPFQPPYCDPFNPHNRITTYYDLLPGITFQIKFHSFGLIIMNSNQKVNLWPGNTKCKLTTLRTITSTLKPKMKMKRF